MKALLIRQNGDIKVTDLRPGSDGHPVPVAYVALPGTLMGGELDFSAAWQTPGVIPAMSFNYNGKAGPYFVYEEVGNVNRG